MHNLAYREGRVQVTEAITKELYRLVTKEKDIEQKKKHPAKWYRDEVAKSLNLREVDNPSLRSYESELKPIRQGLRSKSPLDEPWSIGLCNKYPIPPEIIPLLMKQQKTIKDRLTIRQVLWQARLYPMVKTYTEKLDNNLERFDAYLFFIADQYGELERLSEVTDWRLDTVNLDYMYFMREPPADINEGFIFANFGPAAAESYRTNPKVNEYKEQAKI